MYDGVIDDLGFDAADVKAQTEGWVQVQTLSHRAGVIVVLPKVMQWYRADFGRGSGADCVRAACLYLPERQRSVLAAALSGQQGEHTPREAQRLTITYGTYEFSCRVLRPTEQNVGGFFAATEDRWSGPGGGASFD